MVKGYFVPTRLVDPPQDLEHTSTSCDDSKTDEDDHNVPLAQVANKVSFIILENMGNENRKKINVFTFLVVCFRTEDNVNLTDKHTQGKSQQVCSKHQQRISKGVAAFPLLSKKILLIKTIVANNNVQRPDRRCRTVLCMCNQHNTYSLDAILSPRNVN